MSGQQVEMVTMGCFVIVAGIGVITTSRGLARAISEASWEGSEYRSGRDSRAWA